jgi:uncharacterized membrane protein YhaH (DUF805 family)
LICRSSGARQLEKSGNLFNPNPVRSVALLIKSNGSMRYNLQWYFLSFKGRIRRMEFWLGYVGILILVGFLSWPVLYLFRLAGVWHNPRDVVFALTFYVKACVLVSAWPVAAIYAKRLHDIGLSAWWVIVGPLVLLIPEIVSSVLSVLLPLAIPVVLGSLPGITGPNQFGDDPHGNVRS